MSATFPWNTPYSFAENDVIRSIDLDGLQRVSVITTSFAPFDFFGSDLFGTYKGDGNNRRFGDGGSYKVTGGVTLDLSTYKKVNTFAGRALSIYHRNHSPFPDYKSVSPSRVDVTHFMGNPKTQIVSLRFQVSGKNNAALYSCDIDDKVDIFFAKMAENEFLVSGIVMGDRFPANETSITDEAGNNLLLGVSGVNLADKDLAPYLVLPGDNNRKMSDFSMIVTFKKDSQNRSVFDKVRTTSGVEFSIKDWNKIFTRLNPRSTSTGTSGKTAPKPYEPSSTNDNGTTKNKSGDYSY